MTALAANRAAPSRDVNTLTIGVKANVRIYAGGFVFNDAGVGRGGVPTATTPVLGVAVQEANNIGGADNAISVSAHRSKAFPFANGTAGDALAASELGKAVYAIDDATVGKTDGGATRPVAGILVAIDAYGCWVEPKK